VTAYRAVMALGLPDPPPGPQAAVTGQAAQAFAAAARTGSDVITADPQPVAAARAAETAHRDHAAIIAALRETGPLELCRTADRHRAAIIDALKARHAAIIAELIPAARRLPAAISETAALDQGGAVRLAYLSTRDLAAQAEALRSVLVSVEDVPARTPMMPGGLEISLAYIRDPRIYDGPLGAYGDPGTAGFYRRLGAETEPSDWWLSTTAERAARADEVIEERRDAAVADLPRGATVW
jgi:hypothetical protein